MEYEKAPTLYQREVNRFKKQLLRTTRQEHRGNRTHAACTLGIRRTYLIRLIHAFDIDVPHE